MPPTSTDLSGAGRLGDNQTDLDLRSDESHNNVNFDGVNADAQAVLEKTIAQAQEAGIEIIDEPSAIEGQLPEIGPVEPVTPTPTEPTPSAEPSVPTGEGWDTSDLDPHLAAAIEDLTKPTSEDGEGKGKGEGEGGVSPPPHSPQGAIGLDSEIKLPNGSTSTLGAYLETLRGSQPQGITKGDLAELIRAVQAGTRAPAPRVEPRPKESPWDKIINDPAADPMERQNAELNKRLDAMQDLLDSQAAARSASDEEQAELDMLRRIAQDVGRAAVNSPLVKAYGDVPMMRELFAQPLVAFMTAAGLKGRLPEDTSGLVSDYERKLLEFVKSVESKGFRKGVEFVRAKGNGKQTPARAKPRGAAPSAARTEAEPKPALSQNRTRTTFLDSGDRTAMGEAYLLGTKILAEAE